MMLGLVSCIMSMRVLVQYRVESGLIVLINKFIIKLHVPYPIFSPGIKFRRLDSRDWLP